MDGTAYRAGAVVISSDFAPYAESIIDDWRARGVRVDGPTASAFDAAVRGVISSIPSIILDEDNGAIVE